MNLWTDGNGAIIWDTSQYIDSQGSTWTVSSDKSKIPGLLPVTQTARPTDPTLIVNGFTLGKVSGVWTQTWTTTPKPLAQQDQTSAALAISSGIVITSTGTPALNGTYALDQLSINEIDEVILYIDTNETFPESATELPYPDSVGAMHVFQSIAQFKAFGTAVADLVALIDEYASSGGTVGSIPSNAVTIA